MHPSEQILWSELAALLAPIRYAYDAWEQGLTAHAPGLLGGALMLLCLVGIALVLWQDGDPLSTHQPREAMHTSRLIPSIVLLLIPTSLCLAQAPREAIAPTSAPPPTEPLAVFEPFLGLYTFAGEFSGAPYRGTLEVRPAVKGWYVEWIINVHGSTADGPQVDRQLRMLASWDRFAKTYRIWRFETDNPVLMGGGTAHFDGEVFVMEWTTGAPEGSADLFRNRVTMHGPDELVIVSEGERMGSAVERIGVGTGTRRL